VVVLDGRVVGRGCLALRRQVVSKGGARPGAWRGRHRPTGHGPEDLPSAVVARRSRVSPQGAKVVVLGDGACDGTARQATRSELGGSDVCRTARRTTAPGEGETLRLEV
jgi:hypothetical protein